MSLPLMSHFGVENSFRINDFVEVKAPTNDPIKEEAIRN